MRDCRSRTARALRWIIAAAIKAAFRKALMKTKLDLLIEFTKDEDARSRATAIAGLAKIRDPKGFAPVLVALFDPVDEVRITAATALGVFGDDRAIEPLLACLDDPCEQVAVNCIWALGQLPSQKAAESLLALLENQDLALTLRTAAVTAVGERISAEGNDIVSSAELLPRAKAALLALTSAEDDELRATSTWAFGHLPKDEAVVNALIIALQDEYEWVVRYAIEALAVAGVKEALEPLLALSTHDNENVKGLAAQALEGLGHTSA